MDALELLQARHREIEAGLEDVTTRRDKRERFRAFAAAADQLVAHLLLTEKYLYPEAEGLYRGLPRLVERHARLRGVVGEILQAGDASLTFEIKVKVLRDWWDEHVDEEELRLFPLLRHQVSRLRLRQIGKSMLLSPPAEAQPGQVAER